MEAAAGTWVSTDEAEDVAGSIRHALRCGDLVRDDALAWKWLALSLHSALQGACVCHLTTTAAPVGAVTDRNAGEWLAYFEESRTNPDARPPRTQLMALPDLLKAIRRPCSAGDRSNGTGVTLSDAEFAWLKQFHETIRNQFVHFEPMGWSIEVSGVPEIGVLIARLIGEIAQAGHAFRHKEKAWRDALARDLVRLSEPARPDGGSGAR